MSNISSLDYSSIDQPYNDFLERAPDGVDAGVGGEASGGIQVTSPNEMSANVIDGSSLKDVYLESWMKSKNYRPKSQGFLIDGIAGYIEANKLYIGSGGIEGGSIHIANETDANSFHVDSDGNTWWGANVATGYDGANAYVLNTGVAKFQNVTLSGSVIVTDFQSGTDIAIQGWSSTLVFTASNYRTVGWSAGSDEVIKILDGTTYTLTAGNTGSMSAKTYIYLDINTSTTALQFSYTYSNAVGKGKILIGVAQNNSDVTSKAQFQVFGGEGGEMIGVDNIAANSASTNEFVSNTAQIKDLVVTDAKIDTLGVDKLTAGIITSKAVTLAVTPLGGSVYFNAGKTGFGDTTAGFILGIDDDVAGDPPKFEIGDANYYFNWTGTGINLKTEHSNLELYDYVVDAAGYGDYTTVKAAIDAATAASDTEVTIFVRKGTYTQTGNIAFTGNVTIVGENKDETIVNCTSATAAEWLDVTGVLEISDIKVTKTNDGEYIVKATGASSVVKSCIFENSHNDGTGTADGKCVTLTGDNSKAMDCYITKAVRGINFTSVANGIIENNYIETQSGVQSRGIDIIADSDDTTITNNTVILKRTSTSEGIYGVSNRLTISGNNISNSAGTNGTGIYLIAPGAGTTTFEIISDNTINAVTDGIFVDASYSHVSIKNNHIKTTNGGAIKVAAAAIYFEVCGNVLDTGSSGIYFTSSLDYSHIDNNTLTGFGTGVKSINVAGSMTYSSVDNNIIKDGGGGISLDGNIDNSNVNNNVLNNTTGIGILLDDRCLRSNISNNVIRSSSAVGIQSNGLTQQSVISGNCIDSAGNSGIRFNNSVFDAIVNNNQTNNCGDDGIEFGAQNCAGTQVIGNHCESNTDDGIVANYATHNLYMVINSNCCLGNGDTGIKVDTRSSTIVGNVVVNNTTAQITDADGTGSVNTNNVVA